MKTKSSFCHTEVTISIMKWHRKRFKWVYEDQSCYLQRITWDFVSQGEVMFPTTHSMHPQSPQNPVYSIFQFTEDRTNVPCLGKFLITFTAARNFSSVDISERSADIHEKHELSNNNNNKKGKHHSRTNDGAPFHLCQHDTRTPLTSTVHAGQLEKHNLIIQTKRRCHLGTGAVSRHRLRTKPDWTSTKHNSQLEQGRTGEQQNDSLPRPSLPPPFLCFPIVHIRHTAALEP